MLFKYMLPIIVLSFSMNSIALSFKAGFARVEITPKVGDILNMVDGGTGKIKVIGDPLYIKSAVLTDGKNRIALISVDVIDLRASDFDSLKKTIKSKGFDHVIIAVTHTHGGMFGDELLDGVREKIIRSIDLASASLQPVKIGATSVVVDEAYNRRVVKNKTVEMLWSNPSRAATREVDKTLGIIHIKHEDNSPFLTVFNYSAHPVITFDINQVTISADYPGYLSESFERGVGGQTMFFMGASGDVNPYHAGTTPFDEARIKARDMGDKLSIAAHKAIRNLKTYVNFEEFTFDTVLFDEPRAEVSLLMLTSDISIAGFPGEYFDELGREFRAGSPTASTFFIGKSNGDLRYIPTSKDVELGGFGADKSTLRVKSETGEVHIREALNRLNSLAKMHEESNKSIQPSTNASTD